MTLAELGALLLEERVSRGYTVEEVASRLKITSRMVRAIEDGDVDSLPHAVYARGFVRAYAALLDLDEKAVHSALHCLSDVQHPAGVQEPDPETVSAARRPRGPVILCIILCCAGLALFGYVHFHGFDPVDQFSFGRSEVAVPAPDPSPLPEAVEEKGETPSNESGKTGSVSRSDTVRDDSPAHVEVPDRARSENESVRAEGFAVPSVEASSAPGPQTLTLQDGISQTDLTNAGRGKHQIILSAQQECWVHSSADGTDIRQFSLKKGEVFALSFESRLTLKLGNAGGVRIKYDGREMPAAGSMGQVRTLVFPPQD